MSAAVGAGACATLALMFAGIAVAGREGGPVAALAGDEPRARRSRPRIHPRFLVVPLALASFPVGMVLAGVPGGIAASVVSAAAPRMVRHRNASRAARRAEEQLPDAISALATAVRAGRSLVQALSLAAAEVPEPVGSTLRVAADRIALGTPLDEALRRWAIDLGGPDARVAAGVLRLHHRTGGALPAALEELAATLRARRSGARELRSLTAQARLSAGILGLLPIGFFLFLSAVARRDIQAAYTSTVGATAIALGLGLQAGAFVWIRSLLRVES